MWLYKRDFETTDKLYKTKVIVFAITFILIFPIIALVVPEWERIFGFNGEIYVIPISLENDDDQYTICKSVQSKLFWHKTFKENGIKTPNVYCTSQTLCDLKSQNLDENLVYIVKPEYGTQGSGVEKVKIEEFVKKKYRTNMILQEYVTDCTSKSYRNFRIITQAKNPAEVFFVDEKVNDKIAANIVNGGKATVCKNTKCNHLTRSEQMYIEKIKKRLCTLHDDTFKIIPFIGWDIILSCHGAVVLEGNLGTSISDSETYKRYINEIKLNVY
jgi:glutathione synthase/RimK-type ligase-like ATP-grasp enzyme